MASCDLVTAPMHESRVTLMRFATESFAYA